jgi:two-component system chemotaxis response regulator CheY
MSIPRLVDSTKLFFNGELNPTAQATQEADPVSLANSALSPTNEESSLGTDGSVRRRSVLLVEDDADAREMLAIVLSDAGCEVRTASDGKAALDVAMAHRLDLIVTDVAMPRMDGIQMVHLLRQLPATRNIPVIVLTGQAVADVPARAQAAGCTIVLSKPCPPDYLVSVINQLIGSRVDDPARTTKVDTYAGDERRRN